MIRMAEARAAMHLREYVNDDDIDCAIRCVGGGGGWGHGDGGDALGGGKGLGWGWGLCG